MSSILSDATPPSGPIKVASNLAPSASAHLDAVRALAAQIVCIGHIRVLFLVDYHDIAPLPGFVANVLYWLCGLQHESVVVFFVLSGLLISRKVTHNRREGPGFWRDYLTNRLVRLYVVLIPGLFVGLFWDRLGYGLPSTHWLYIEPLEHFSNVTIASQMTLGAFFGNLAFLQTIFVPTFGSNLPLWSLACEFWYYMLFPFMLFGWLAWRDREDRNSGHGLRRSAIYFLLSGLVLWMIGPEKIVWFLIWLFGFGVCVLHEQIRFSRNARTVLRYSGALLFVAALSIARMRIVNIFVSDLVVGAAFSVLLLSLLQRENSSSVQYSRLARAAADFSYSGYIVHFPFIVFLRALLVSHERWQPDGQHLLYGVLIAVATLLYAYVFSVLTEYHTRRVKQWIRRKRAPAPTTNRAPSSDVSFPETSRPAAGRATTLS